MNLFTMKTIKNYLLAFSILGLSSFTFAQDIGHIKSVDIIEILPGKKAADEQIITKQKEYEQEIKKMTQELQAAYEKAQNDVQTKKLNPQQQQELGAELEAKQKRIEEYKQTAGSAIQKLNESLYEPILIKFKNAISIVASKKKLKYVLDASADSVILIADGLDITEDVKKELGIK